MNYSVSETEELKPTARQIVSPVQPNPPPGNRPLCRLPTTGPHPVVPVARSDRIAQIQRFMGLIAVHIVFIAAVATLFGLSASRDGLWKVKDWNYIKETQGRFVDRSLWWTAVPTFFFSALGLYMKRCYDDVLELEPFLRLHQKPTSGASSVLLNYRSSFAPLAMIKAARHRHWISGLALGLTTFFTMLLVPLSSHLLETKLYQQRDEGLAWQTTNINLARMSGNADFNRAIDITSALGIYKGGGNVFSQWMNDKYIFPTFIPMNGTWGYNTTVEIPAVPGYYSSLATCGFVDEDDYELAALGGGNTNTTDTTVRLTANRDGCEMKLEFDVERFGYDMYFPIAAAECSETASNGAGTVTVPKLLFLLAWPKPGATESLALATQLTVCTPVYGVDVGTLHVGVLGTHDTKSVKSYEPETCFSEASEGCKGFVDADGSREEFRAVIKAIADLDDSQDLARVKTSKFGTLILNNYDINRRDATLPLTVEWPSDAQEMRDDLITAAQAVYRTLFLAASSTIATDAAGWPLDFRNATVQVVTDTERLFAVGWVCCFTLAVLLGSLGLAIWACLRSVEMRDWDVNAPSNIIQTLGLIAGSEELLSVGADIKRAGEGTFEDAAVNDWNCGKARFMVEANGTDRILRMYPHDSRDS